MKESEINWKKQLSDSPHPTRGFSNELMRNIQQQKDGKARSTRSITRGVRVFAAVAAIALLVFGSVKVGVGVWGFGGKQDVNVSATQGKTKDRFAGSSANWLGVYDLSDKKEILKLYYQGEGQLNSGEQVTVSADLPTGNMRMNQTIMADGIITRTETLQTSTAVKKGSSIEVTVDWQGKTEKIKFVQIADQKGTVGERIVNWNGRYYDVLPIEAQQKGNKVDTASPTDLDIYERPGMESSKDVIVTQNGKYWVSVANGTVTMEGAQAAAPFQIILPGQFPYGMVFQHAKVDKNLQSGKVGVTLFFASLDQKWQMAVHEQEGSTLSRMLGGSVKELEIGNGKGQYETDTHRTAIIWTNGKVSCYIMTEHNAENQDFGSEQSLVEIVKQFH